MRKLKDPRDIAIALLSRSICSVQVAAVLADRHGIYSWGWNNSGRDGMGEHAEMACLRRTNHRRAASGSILYIAARRLRNARSVTARPCFDCLARIRGLGIGRVVWRAKDGSWTNTLSHPL